MSTPQNVSSCRRTLGAALTVLALAAFSLPASAQSTFNFDSDTVGKQTTFTDASKGLSATFSSPSDPGIFTVQPTFFQGLNGNVLGPGTTGATFVPLDIAFSSPVSALSLSFALQGFNTDSLTLTAFSGGLNGTKIGSATATGSTPGGVFLFPEGSLTFTGTSPFDTVAVTSTAQGFAVDNLQVSASAPVPEASSMVSLCLLLLGLGGVVAAARRKKAGGAA